jgi:glycosyltransferase involved in cell wall biosynthesis
MIVKDEAEVIERCLASCRGLIDYWVICDTGSSDGTQALIRECLEGIPGELFEHEWVDFGHNRSEMLRQAHGKADYLLLLDADMTLNQNEPLPELGADSYLVRQGNDGLDYRNKRIVRGDLRWRFVGRTHEYLECMDEESAVEQLDAVTIEHHADGHSWGEKFERDLEMLTEELSENPDEPRTVFYLAQTHRDLAKATGDDEHLRLALEHYQRRVGMGGWAEETYVAQYHVGLMRARLDDWPGAINSFIQAWEMRPTRLEAVHALAVGLRERENYRTAHRFTMMAAGKRALRPPDDILFVSPWVYNWGMLFEFSITAYWVGDLDRSVTACVKLLRREDLPAAYRRQTTANLQCALQARERLAKASAERTRTLEHVGNPTRGRSA